MSPSWSSSQDVFQKRMDQILEECEGCIEIADDITVHGCTEAEHDAHLWKLMEVAQKYGLVLNPKKTQVKALMVRFFGCLYDESGVHPDPEKVDVVHVLPTPTNITELQEFLGMVHTSALSFLAYPPWLLPCMSCSRRMLNSARKPPIKQHFNMLRMMLLVTLPFNTLMPHVQ